MELNVMLVESWEHFPLEYGLHADASNSIERSNVSLQQYTKCNSINYEMIEV